MKKQIMLLLGLLSLLIPAGFVISGSASADHEEPCVPTDAVAASYGEWTNEGPVIRTEENVPPGEDTDRQRFVFVGETDPEVIVEAKPAQHYVHAHNEQDGLGNDEVPPTPEEDPSVWQANTTHEPHHSGGDPAQQPDGSTYVEGEAGLHYTSHGSSGRRDWFYFQPAVAEVTDIDYLWQKQVRTFTPGTPAHTCDTEVEGEQTCPTDAEINAGKEIPEGQTAKEFCNKDNPPNPPDREGEQDTPEVAGKQQRAPMQQPAAPAAEVPTSVDAGL